MAAVSPLNPVCFCQCDVQDADRTCEKVKTNTALAVLKNRTQPLCSTKKEADIFKKEDKKQEERQVWVLLLKRQNLFLFKAS